MIIKTYLHKKLSYFFNTSYNDVYYDSTYKNIFIEFIKNSEIDLKKDAIDLINGVTEGTVDQFIDAYTGENILCYSLNRWMRKWIILSTKKLSIFLGLLVMLFINMLIKIEIKEYMPQRIFIEK